jgi:hypothetical protein
MATIAVEADGLLKIRKAGFLAQVSETHACFMPDEVYRETVLAARAAHAEEVEAIEGFIAGGKLRDSTSVTPLCYESRHCGGRLGRPDAPPRNQMMIPARGWNTGYRGACHGK